MDRVAGVPQEFGDYELIEELGHGGMGVVWRARQKGLGREVALKMILGGHRASSEQVLRFHTEARAAARLDHPNIVPIHEIGEVDGSCFYSMRLIEGASLAEVLSRAAPPARAFTQREAAQLVSTMARAVHFAHQRGVLHRDLKPSNILLDAARRPHVSDFGLARLSGQGDGATISGSVLGTPAYMAPEQAQGPAGAVTTSADVYSLGAVLLEILTGQPPFRGETPLRTLRLVLEAPPPSPRALDPGISRDLEVICLKCLQKEPEKRYASAAELAEDLERWLSGLPIAARPVSRWARTVAWARRKPELATSLGALSATLALALVISLIFYRRLEREVDARAGALRAEEAQRLAFQSLGVVRDNPGQALLLALDAADREQSLSVNNALLGALEACLEERRLLGHASSVTQVAFSPQGDQLASSAYDGTVRLWNVSTGECERVLQVARGPVSSTGYSPDGEHLLTVGLDGGAALWEARTGNLVRHLALDGAPCRSATFAPGGHAVLCLTERSAHLVTLRQESGATLRDLGPGKRSTAAFSPDGRQLALGSPGKSIELWDLAASASPPRTLPVESPVHQLAFSADGRRFAAALDAGGAVWEAATGQRVSTLAGHRYLAYSIVLSPDGSVAATGSEDFTARIWDVATGRCLQVLPHGHKVTHVALTPDASRLVTASFDKLARVWRFPSGELLSEMKGNAAPLTSLCVGPRGDRIATGGIDHTVRVWRLDPLQPKHIADGSRERARCAVEVPGGNLILLAISGDPSLHLLDRRTGARVGHLEGHRGPVLAVGTNRDGSLALSGSADHGALLWDLGARAVRKELAGHLGEVRIVGFSPDGSRAVTGSVDGSARVWSASTGELVANFAGGPKSIRAVRFDDSGERVAIVHQEGTVRIGEVSTGAEVYLPRSAFGYLSSLSFGPGKELLLTTGITTRAHLRRLHDGGVVGTLVHPARVTMATYSSDRSWILTLADDGVVRVWNAETLEGWLEIRRPECLPTDLEPSWDPTTIQVSWVSFGVRDEPPRTVLSYPVVPLEAARSIKPGELTPDERDHFRVGTAEDRRARRTAWRGGQIFGGPAR